MRPLGGLGRSRFCMQKLFTKQHRHRGTVETDWKPGGPVAFSRACWAARHMQGAAGHPFS